MSARPKVGLFVTCLVDMVRPGAGFASAKLLEAAGCDVHVPRAQTCCGQPAWNAGDDKNAAAIARAVITAFETFDYVVVPSASCAGTIKNHYPEILKHDREFLPRAKALAAKTHELISFLVNERGMKNVAVKGKGKICYHASCSSLREIGLTDEPQTLLQSVEGAELCALKEPEVCCGFGGLFAVKYPEISERMADQKIADVQGSGADILVSADLGCLLHLAGRMARAGKPMDVRHIAEILVGDTATLGLGESKP